MVNWINVLIWIVYVLSVAVASFTFFFMVAWLTKKLHTRRYKKENDKGRPRKSFGSSGTSGTTSGLEPDITLRERGLFQESSDDPITEPERELERYIRPPKQGLTFLK